MLWNVAKRVSWFTIYSVGAAACLRSLIQSIQRPIDHLSPPARRHVVPPATAAPRARATAAAALRDAAAPAAAAAATAAAASALGIRVPAARGPCPSRSSPSSTTRSAPASAARHAYGRDDGTAAAPSRRSPFPLWRRPDAPAPRSLPPAIVGGRWRRLNPRAAWRAPAAPRFARPAAAAR